MEPNPDRKKLTLSPDALAALKLPVTSWLNEIEHGGNRITFMRVDTNGGNFQDDCEIAAFIAALLNEALTPAEPVRMCHMLDCLNAADPTTAGGAFCIQHDAELRAERWTATDILRREG